MNGALLVDKPVGPTSHDVVAIARRALAERRIGHTGTLDPLASGLLVLLIGSATRLAQFLVADEKEYVADIRLGIATPTYDAQGLQDRGSRLEDRVSPNLAPRTSDVELDRVLDQFRGTFMQTPPPHSAKKVEGVRAYKRARTQQAVELQPVEVTVKELEKLDPGTDGPRDPRTQGPKDPGTQGPKDPGTQGPKDPRTQGPRDLGTEGLLRLRLVVSSGFYVRSLAHDIGQRLGCGAHLEALRRTRVGQFRVDAAIDVEQLVADAESAARRVIPPNALLESLPRVRLTADGTRRAAHGNAVGFPAMGSDPILNLRTHDWGQTPGRVRLIGADGELVAVAERRPDGLLHPVVVLR